VTSITYHDLASEYYMAYAVDGLMAEAAKRGCKFSVSKEPPVFLRQIDLGAQDRNLIYSLGIFQVKDRSTTTWFCIDSHDDSSAQGYFRSVLHKVDAYFKLNCNPSVFSNDAELSGSKEKIHSLGCTFSVRPSRPWLFFPRLRPCTAYRWNWLSVKRRLRFFQSVPNLEWHRQLRLQEPNHDVFLVRRYYHETGHSQSNEVCSRIFESVKQHTKLSGPIGFTNTSAATPARFLRHAVGPDRTHRCHLTQAARSRVCVYIPGTYDCLSFKFGQYLALGKPVIGLRLPFWPLPDMDNASKAVLEEQFCCSEPEQIPMKLLELLQDTRRMAALSASNVSIYERYLSPRAVAGRILDRVI
jgi:hypothetical protein